MNYEGVSHDTPSFFCDCKTLVPAFRHADTQALHQILFHGFGDMTD